MKNYWMPVVVAGVLMTSAAAQSGAGASTSGNASVSAGQNGASAGASQNAQTSNGSTNAQVDGQAQASKKSNKKNESGNSSASASGSGAANGAAAALSGGTTLQAELTKSLDAKKAKPGDEITARLTQDVKSNGQVVVRKGSKLVGHVTEAKARGKEDSESRLGILFDRAVLKDGQEVAFNSVIQAVAAAPNVSSLGDNSGPIGGGAPMPQPSGGMQGGGMGGAVGAVGSTVGGAASTVGNTAGSVGTAASGTVNGTVNGAGAAGRGGLGTASRGVIGLEGLTLNSAASGNAQGSVISSPSRNVKLDSGTQMVLLVSGSAQ
ncbi:MAG TPA: hypothetical protein VNV88_08185 [Candidatus Solibacter sp.]|jgi:hypothetical protein|nr:hypothetical protein [Candidatus Solibacter sp.]